MQSPLKLRTARRLQIIHHDLDKLELQCQATGAANSLANEMGMPCVNETNNQLSN